tara:strand:+ start:3829 stop:4155 length:327 start_codon:yes stop_codon:yes gene_type:complete
MAQNLVMIELTWFEEYLTDTCGLATATRDSRTQHVGAFLSHVGGTDTMSVLWLLATDIDAYFSTLGSRQRPASLRIACNSLRSYFRYRAVRGDETDGLAQGNADHQRY